MPLSSPISSPLAEKRIIFFTLKKQMIGRRAYTDSIFIRTRQTMLNNLEERASPYSTSHYTPLQPTTVTVC
jgi:hypothetical protein